MNWVEAPDNWWIKREEIINPYWGTTSTWKYCDLVEIEWTLDLNNAPEEANTCTAIRLWGQVYWYVPINADCERRLSFSTRRMYPLSSPECKPSPFRRDQFDLTDGTPVTITWEGEEFNLADACVGGGSGTFDWLKLQNFTGDGEGSLASTYITKVEMYIDWTPPTPLFWTSFIGTTEVTP